MLCRFKDCGKCRGDLVLDGDAWRCWQCGTYYYLHDPREPTTDLPMDFPELKLGVRGSDSEDGFNQPRARRRTKVHINAVIASKERSEIRWWDKNQDIIARLKKGETVRNISEVVGKGQRQIRGVQERLKDMALA